MRVSLQAFANASALDWPALNSLGKVSAPSRWLTGLTCGGKAVALPFVLELPSPSGQSGQARQISGLSQSSSKVPCLDFGSISCLSRNCLPWKRGAGLP